MPRYFIMVFRTVPKNDGQARWSVYNAFNLVEAYGMFPFATH